MDYQAFPHGPYLKIKTKNTLTFSYINNKIKLITK